MPAANDAPFCSDPELFEPAKSWTSPSARHQLTSPGAGSAASMVLASSGSRNSFRSLAASFLRLRWLPDLGKRLFLAAAVGCMAVPGVFHGSTPPVRVPNGGQIQASEAGRRLPGQDGRECDGELTARGRRFGTKEKR